jgi:hypothetical protein
MMMVWVLRVKHLFDISERSAISSVRVTDIISVGGLVNEKKKMSIIWEGYQYFGQVYLLVEFLATILE